MPIGPPFTALRVRKAASGFYKGNSLEVVLVSKAILIALVIWALVWPASANGVLGSLNDRLLEEFNVFYIVIVGLFAIFLFVFKEAVPIFWGEPATAVAEIPGPNNDLAFRSREDGTLLNETEIVLRPVDPRPLCRFAAAAQTRTGRSRTARR